jgi:hypothetical protein
MIFCLSLAGTGRFAAVYIYGAHCKNFTKEAHTKIRSVSLKLYFQKLGQTNVLFAFLQRASLVILLCRSWFVSRDPQAHAVIFAWAARTISQ